MRGAVPSMSVRHRLVAGTWSCLEVAATPRVLNRVLGPDRSGPRGKSASGPCARGGWTARDRAGWLGVWPTRRKLAHERRRRRTGREAPAADRGDRVRRRGTAAAAAERGARHPGDRCWSGPRDRRPGPTGSASLLGKDDLRDDGDSPPAASTPSWPSRVRVLEGDLGDVPALPADLDAVVHCAGDVSFDPPVDEGFRTNVVGTRDLLARIARWHRGRAEPRPLRPHLHGVRRRPAPRHDPGGPGRPHGRRRGRDGLGPRPAPRRRARSPAAPTCWPGSAAPRRARARPRRTAHRGRRHRGAPQDWVKRGAGQGRHRACPQRSAGPTATPSPRPSASASSRSTPAPPRSRSSARASSSPRSSRPYPGWIEGFKMAEPLILAYGRGELPEFPAAGDTIVDIVPVDHVVAAIVAVLAHPPGAAARRRTSTSPPAAATRCTFRTLYAAVRAYFDEHPFEIGDRGAGPAARVAVPGRPERRAAAGHRASAPTGSPTTSSGTPRASDRTRDRPQPRPAGPAAGVPAALPRPLSRSTPRPSCASTTPTRTRCLSRACTPTTGPAFAFDIDDRRLGPLPARGALPGRHRPDPARSTRCAATAPSRRREQAAPRRAVRGARPPPSSTWTARCSRPT